jgi:hypothetical protein
MSKEINQLNELATGLQHGLFASRETIQDAFKYAYEMIETLPAEYKAGAYTTLHVVVNTIAEEVKRITGE